MNQRAPQLKRHPNGQWYCKWAGKFRYFGTDHGKAMPQYLESLKEWGEWRKERDVRITAIRKDGVLTCQELADQWLALKKAEGGRRREVYYEGSLRLFLAAYRNVRADEVRAKHVLAFKLDMMEAREKDGTATYKPKTVNHCLSAVRSLFNWGMSLELIPAVNLTGVKGLRVPRTDGKAYEYEEVWAFIRSVPEHLGNWLALQFLTAMRPSEVPRVVHEEGEWEEPWLFRLHQSKSEWKTGVPRRIVFSDAALSYLRLCEPRWTRQDTYFQAVYRAVHGKAFAGYAPHPLRHSAATYLGRQGVPREDIDHLLGHLPSAVSWTYNPVFWQRLREPADRIASSKPKCVDPSVKGS